MILPARRQHLGTYGHRDGAWWSSEHGVAAKPEYCGSGGFVPGKDIQVPLIQHLYDHKGNSEAGCYMHLPNDTLPVRQMHTCCYPGLQLSCGDRTASDRRA